MSSGDTEVIPKPLTKDLPEHVHDSHDEEYESADDAYEEGDEEEVEVEIEEEVEDEEEGDEDSKLDKDKELDDDEDRKNPQFIPKKGYFYEHDDRTKTDEEGEEEEPKKEDPKKKPVTTKEPNRWSHDLFDQDQQAPKSKEELSQAYGYDIWSEENAPRARRRRRYGRGPNKYTRQWEDEEAYQKPRGGGFRGRGGGGGRGRGNYRDSARRGGGEDGYEEEFPELAPGSKPQNQGKSESITDRRGSAGSGGNLENEPNKPQPRRERNDNRQQNRDGNDHRQQHREGNDHHRQQYNRDVNESRPHQKEGYEPRQQNRERREDYSRRSDGDNERYGSQRGGRGGFGGGGRGRGRRNEFSNRNRYPARREDEDTGTANNTKPGGQSEVRERVENRPQRALPVERKEREIRVPNTNGHGHDVRPKESPLPSKPPFTTTEYTGSASTTAHRNTNRNQNANNPSSNKQFENVDGNKALRMGGGGQQQGPGNGYAEKPRDLREVLNARRDARMQQNTTTDRRSQMPPRLQQQAQQQQHQHQQQQQQHQVEQVSAKPKRFSTQRQRQVEQSIVNPTGVINTSGGIPTSAPMSQGGIPNMLPVVTGTEQMVPSPVPNYPQAPTYYDGSQVYETSGSPVTVATVATNGTSVSPSLWTPHVYANAPYPSPPTGPQVPQPPYAEHPAYIAAQPTGPIYSGPPPFIQDPTMMNYPPTAPPPFGPPYHPQGFQGYPQVAPVPPPEVYHGGVTYYSPQTQIQRQPMMAPQKRPKSVLQLVEPPGKGKTDRREVVHHEHQPHTDVHTENDPNGSRTSPIIPIEQFHPEQELVQKLESMNLEQPSPEPTEQKRKPSPLPPQESWSAQMEEFNSPTETSPETSFKKESEPELEPITSLVVEKTSIVEEVVATTKLESDVPEKLSAESIKTEVEVKKTVEENQPEVTTVEVVTSQEAKSEPKDEEK